MSYNSRVPDWWPGAIPVLNGRVCLVREVLPSDSTTLVELLTDPEVTAYLSPPPDSVEAMAGFAAWCQQERAAGKSVCFGIVPHGLCAAVGIIQVRALEPSWFTAEWGFAIGRVFWSTGVFVDAANLVAEYVFGRLRVGRLEARAVVGNGRAHAVLQKLGARPEGSLAKSFRTLARTDSQLLWSLREEDWRHRPTHTPRVSAADATAEILRTVAEARRVLEARSVGAKALRPQPFFLTD